MASRSPDGMRRPKEASVSSPVQATTASNATWLAGWFRFRPRRGLQACGKLLLPDRAAGAVTDDQLSNLSVLPLSVHHPGVEADQAPQCWVSPCLEARVRGDVC